MAGRIGEVRLKEKSGGRGRLGSPWEGYRYINQTGPSGTTITRASWAEPPATSNRPALPSMPQAQGFRQPRRSGGISRPVLAAVSAHGLASERHCALASMMRVTMANRSKVLCASRSMRVTVTTSPGPTSENPATLRSIGLGSARNFAVERRPSTWFWRKAEMRR